MNVTVTVLYFNLLFIDGKYAMGRVMTRPLCINDQVIILESDINSTV